MTSAREKIEKLLKDSVSPYRNGKEKTANKKVKVKKITPLINTISTKKNSKLVILLIFGYILLLIASTFNI